MSVYLYIREQTEELHTETLSYCLQALRQITTNRMVQKIYTYILKMKWRRIEETNVWTYNSHFWKYSNMH